MTTLASSMIGPEIRTIELSTGVTVRLRKVSPFVLNDIRQAWERLNPKPQPPQVEVNYGNGNVGYEAAYEDQTYQLRVRYWERRMEEETTEGVIQVLMDWGVECDSIDSDWVATYRTYMKETHGFDLQSSDKVIYLTRFAFTQGDLDLVRDELMQAAAPTEEALQRAKRKS